MSLVCWDWFHWVSKNYSDRFKFFWYLSRDEQHLSTKPPNYHYNLYYQYSPIFNENSIYWGSPMIQELDLESIISHLSNRYCLLKSVPQLTIAYIQITSQTSNGDIIETNPISLSDIDSIFSKYSKDQWTQLLSQVERLELAFQKSQHPLEFIQKLLDHGLVLAKLKTLSFVTGNIEYSLQAIPCNLIIKVMDELNPLLRNLESLSLIANMGWYSEESEKISQLILSIPTIQHLSLDHEVINQLVIDVSKLNPYNNIMTSLKEISMNNIYIDSHPMQQFHYLDMSRLFTNVIKFDCCNIIKSRNFQKDMIKLLDTQHIKSFGKNYLEFHKSMSDILYKSKFKELFLNIDYDNTDPQDIKIPFQSLESFGFQFTSMSNRISRFHNENTKMSEISTHLLKYFILSNNNDNNNNNNNNNKNKDKDKNKNKNNNDNNNGHILKSLWIQYLDNSVLDSLLKMIKDNQQLEQLYITFVNFTFSKDSNQMFYKAIQSHKSLRVLYIEVIHQQIDFVRNLLKRSKIDILYICTNRPINFRSKILDQYHRHCLVLHLNNYGYRFIRKYTYLPDISICEIEKSHFSSISGQIFWENKDRNNT